MRFGEASASSGSETTTSSIRRAAPRASKTTAGLFARSRSSRRGARSSPSTHSRTYRSGTEPRHVAFAPGETTSRPPSLRISPSARQCSASVWLVAKSSEKTEIPAAGADGAAAAASRTRAAGRRAFRKVAFIGCVPSVVCGASYHTVPRGG